VISEPIWLKLVKSLNQMQPLLELITLRCRKQTHKRQKILTRQFSLDQEGASMCSLPLSNTQAQNDCQWFLLISLMQSYLPLTWDLSRSEGHNLPWLAKRLGGWVGTYSGGQWSCTAIWKKKQGPFKHASHLRWRPEEFLSNLRG
jgi:hypothetical protein